jgi:murein DD-endopeptidase MepM/ murein hydrolase activator NlpD
MARLDRFDRADFEVPKDSVTTDAKAPPEQVSESPIWPILGLVAADIGDSTMLNRHGRPHKGIDIHAPAGTSVVASRSGLILRKVDGRRSSREKLKRAGLFVDIKGRDGMIYRYLHLGSVDSLVIVGSEIRQGDVVGTLAGAFQSGTGRNPHIHFEVRRSDYTAKRHDYGDAINPLRILPKLAT